MIEGQRQQAAFLIADRLFAIAPTRRQVGQAVGFARQFTIRNRLKARMTLQTQCFVQHTPQIVRVQFQIALGLQTTLR